MSSEVPLTFGSDTFTRKEPGCGRCAVAVGGTLAAKWETIDILSTSN